jgi:hypothetical protein
MGRTRRGLEALETERHVQMALRSLPDQDAGREHLLMALNWEHLTQPGIVAPDECFVIYPRHATDMHAWLQENHRFPLHQARHLLNQLLCGLSSLHSLGIVHLVVWTFGA